MANSITITFDGTDNTGAAVTSVTTNLNKVQAAAQKATGAAAGKTGTGVSGLSAAFGGLNTALGAVGLPALGFTAVIGGLTTAAVKSYQTWQKYAGTVRDVALVTG